MKNEPIRHVPRELIPLSVNFTDPHSKPISDTELWDNFINGDFAALSLIYRQYVQTLYNYGCQFGESSVTQDCIQELFYDLISKRHKLGKVKCIKAYLFASLRRRIHRKLSSGGLFGKNKQCNLDDNFEAELTENPFFEEESTLKIRLEKLKNACNQLPGRQREAILLFYYEKLNYKDLTEVMRLGNISSARMLIHRAITTLRKRLKPI
jgi:RNA polymerase sigma factor (sigma-70 family)